MSDSIRILTELHYNVYNYEGMNRTQIYLPKTQIETLRKIAQKRKVSISEVIRSLIREKLEKVQVKKEGLLAAARRINRLGIKGPKNLATNLDKYLYGRR